MGILNNIFGTTWFIALFGVANMAPVFCCKIPFLAKPVDFGKTWRGKRVFGEHKTWRGILFAPLFAVAFFVLQKYLYQQASFIRDISLFDYEKMPLFYSFLAGLGAILGDLVKSFFKRRVNIAPGKSWVPFDQIDYLIGGMLFGFLFFVPSLLTISLTLLFGFVLHVLFNLLGYALKIKKIPL
ncbi:hypothetical protein COX24_01225 [bacterium (Candidatus Gribaldobacteria) CG23_combo_of_CG06-09_8_20_14_all_37_87_8]|uniref:CDP-2,3-bis-(O-geranylgeranyl)-sn-glycerol synthase n=1 Tax=bacterium (Candidatus Gribaldobacteria) CG23_combo_of_CG06-09_8_20_14_all_37_87_8 TaxID=2014278 RepID=A0A2G9ZFD0_9BACT|nr:MAG: hypothetical protein COX24_01225 [bacterium (Candidatus Gribaldobacteria) CG23_combo_of_CG06-09_8_20_14_all_37_87_8]